MSVIAREVPKIADQTLKRRIEIKKVRDTYLQACDSVVSGQHDENAEPNSTNAERMCQRGINGSMVDFVMIHGRPHDGRFVLDRNDALSLLEALKRDERLLKKTVDKGGLVVVAEGATLLTTYNYDSREHWGGHER